MSSIRSARTGSKAPQLTLRSRGGRLIEVNVTNGVELEPPLGLRADHEVMHEAPPEEP